MANYTAQIRIGVSGQQDLKNLENQIQFLSGQINKINANDINIKASTQALQTLNKYNTTLEETASNLQKVQFGTIQETQAIQAYVSALGVANAASARQNKLIQDEINLRNEQARKARLAAKDIVENANAYQTPAGPKAPTAGQTRIAVTGSEEYLAARRAANTEERIQAVLRRKQDTAQKKQTDAQRGESIALGVGFPLMFGAGPASVAGSLAGSFVGSGFGGQILGGAIGAAFDKIGVAAIEAGKSLAFPIEGFEKLKEAGLFASREQEYYISKLIETGRVAEATAVIQAEMIKKVGVRGVNDLAALGESSIELSKVWAEFNLQLQAALAGPMTGLLKWLTGIVGLVGTINAEKTTAEEVRAGLSSKDRAKFDKEITKIRNAYGDVPGKAITFEEARKRKAQVVQEFKPLSKPIAAQGALTPEDQAKALDKAVANEEKIRGIRKDTISMERAGLDLRVQFEDTSYNLRKKVIDMERQGVEFRRSIEDQIFSKRQDLAKTLIATERQRQQNDIDAFDLQIRTAASGLDPIARSIVDAGAQYLKVRAEGEADLQKNEKELKLQLQGIDQQTSKFKIDVENKIYQMTVQRDEFTREVTKAKVQAERAILDYAIQVEDYRLKMVQHRYDLEANLQKKQQIAEQGGLTGNVKTPAAFRALSDLIGSRESYGGNYGAFNRGGTNQGHTAIGSGIDPNLTSMSLAEIQRRQLAPGVPANQQLHAVGKYQIIGDTLKGLLQGKYGQTGVKATDQFSPDIQEKLGAALASNRIVTGSVNKTMQGLRQEWIGLQNVSNDQLLSAVKSLMADDKTTALPGWLGEIKKGPYTPTGGATTPQATTGGMSAGNVLTPPAPPTAPALPGFPSAPKLVEINDLSKVYLDLQKQTKDAAVAQNAVTATGISLKNASALAALKEQTIAPIQQFVEQTRQMQQENEVRKLRNRLAMEGVAPAIIDGEIRVLEINRTLTSVLKGVNLQTNNLVAATYKSVTGKEANIQATFDLTEATLASLVAQETEISKAEILREKLQKILDLKNSLATAAQGAAGVAVTDARAVAAETAPPGTKLSEFIATATTELKDLESVAVRVSQGIGDAVGNSLTKGIQGLVEGTTTAQQVFADFLKSIGDILIQEGTKMIATYTAIAIAKSLAGLFGGGGGGGGAQGFQMPEIAPGVGSLGPQKIFGFAAGGNPPVGRPSLVGEKGPELFVPSAAGTIIPAGPTAGIREAMANGNGNGATAPILNMSFETTRFGNTDYVSREQLEAAMMQTRAEATKAGARRGMTMTLDKLQQSPSTRSRVGLG